MLMIFWGFAFYYLVWTAVLYLMASKHVVKERNVKQLEASGATPTKIRRIWREDEQACSSGG